VLKLDRSKPVPKPFIQTAPDAWRLRQPEVRFPTQQKRPQTLDDPTHAAPTGTPRQFRHPLLERRQWFGGDLALDLPFDLDKLGKRGFIRHPREGGDPVL